MADLEIKKSLKAHLETLVQKDPRALSAWKRLLEQGFPEEGSAFFKHLRLKEISRTAWQSSPPSPLSSCIKHVPSTVLLQPLSQAFRTFGSFLTTRFQKILREETSPFALFNAAGAPEGLFLYVPPETNVELPVILEEEIECSKGNSIFSPRIVIYVGRGSSLKIQHAPKIKALSYWINGCVDITIDQGGELEWYPLYEDAEEGCHFETIRVHLAQKARFHAVGMTSGASSSFQDYHVTLDGAEADASIQMGWSLNQKRHAFFRVLMDHKQPGCRSLQHFKGILSGISRSRFEGGIHVDPCAQKTEAYQKNAHLLLSEKAIAQSCPTLKVLADDVKASHGATVGQLGIEEIFYLKSRGLSEEEAKEFLIRGFVEELIAQLPDEERKKEARNLIKRSIL